MTVTEIFASISKSCDIDICHSCLLNFDLIPVCFTCTFIRQEYLLLGFLTLDLFCFFLRCSITVRCFLICIDEIKDLSRCRICNDTISPCSKSCCYLHSYFLLHPIIRLLQFSMSFHLISEQNM